MNDSMLNRLECAQELLNDAVKNPESATAALNEAANYLFGYVDYGEHLEGDHYTAEETIYNCLMLDVIPSKDRVAVALFDSLVMLWRDLMLAYDLDPKYHFTRFHMTGEMNARLNDPLYKRDTSDHAAFVVKYPEHYAMHRYLDTVGGTFSELHFLIEARSYFHQPADDDCRQAFNNSDHE